MGDIAEQINYTPTRKNLKVPCPTCLRVIKPEGILNHIKDIHGAQAVIDSGLLPGDKDICLMCNKVVAKTGMKQHMENRHG